MAQQFAAKGRAERERQDAVRKAEKDREEAEKDRKEIEYALYRADKLCDRYRFEAALRFLVQAEDGLANQNLADPAEIRARWEKSMANLKMVETLVEIRKKRVALLSLDDVQAERFANGRDGAYAKAFRDFGIDVFESDSTADQAKLGQQIAELKISASLVAALDDWAFHDRENTQRLLAIATFTDPDPLRRRIRGKLDRLESLNLARQVDMATLSPATLQLLCEALIRNGEEGEAVFHLRQAVLQHPESLLLRLRLGTLLVSTNPSEAIEQYTAASALAPHSSYLSMTLGALLMKEDRMLEAEFAYRRARRIRPYSSLPYLGLGIFLQRLDADRFQESLELFRHAQTLDSPNSPWRIEAAKWIERIEQELDRKLRAVEADPNIQMEPVQALELATYAIVEAKKWQVAARLYQSAMRDPELLYEDRLKHCYHAACAVVRLAAETADRKTASKLRNQALNWLRLELSAFSKIGQNSKRRSAAKKKLQQWKANPHLASVRGWMIKYLPESERAAWSRLWAEVSVALFAPSGSARSLRHQEK